MSRKKKTGRSVKPKLAVTSAATAAAGSSATLSAYQALLNADRWLLVASNVVESIGERDEGARLQELRRSVAARLEHLQQAAYSAFNQGES